MPWHALNKEALTFPRGIHYFVFEREQFEDFVSIGKCAAVAVKSVKTHKVNAYMLNYMVVLPPTFNMVHITPRYGYILEKNK